jgi:hypothetical protein
MATARYVVRLQGVGLRADRDADASAHALGLPRLPMDAGAGADSLSRGMKMSEKISAWLMTAAFLLTFIHAIFGGSWMESWFCFCAAFYAWKVVIVTDQTGDA